MSITNKSRSEVAFILILACVGFACAGEDADRGRALLSDGTAAGDLIEVQTRYTEQHCACLEELGLSDWCYDIAWPDGRPECMRAALMTNADKSTAAIDCHVDAFQQAIDCRAGAPCGSEARDACDLALADAEAACPIIDRQAGEQGQACWK